MSESPSADTPGVRVFPPIFFIGAVVGGELLQFAWPLCFVTPGSSGATALRAAGIVVLIACLPVMLSAVSLFRRAGTNVNPTKPVTAFVVSGPYRFTRNPMYLSLSVMTVGVALISNAVWPLLLLPLAMWLVQRHVIAHEERFLESRFGDEYRGFKSRVRRWI